MSDKSLGVGLDVGTMNFVAARYDESGGIDHKRVKDAYIEIDAENEKTLKMSNITFVEFPEQSEVVVIGDKSFQMANLFKQEVKRPLSKGLISPGAIKAQHVLNNLIENVLGKPACKDEPCFYSVPADPIDLPDQDVKFHENSFNQIITRLGYKAQSTNEAMAIIYSQCFDTEFSGLAISFGSGLCNVALASYGIKGLNFSIARGGGDWVDLHSAKAVGSTAARMCTLKEKGGFNLATPPVGNADLEAISLYVRTMIRHCLEKISERVKQEQNDHLDEIPLVVSGGTSLAGGFMDVFNEEFNTIRKKGFPIPISKVFRVERPLDAVADGLLVLAGHEYKD